ncbi:C39 family peptidase [Bacillus manliponensis]|uniref:C39 family peptidase n=1 Tax=Bacillus manliponensis TaxID=574376 RepID=UPI003513C3F2
MKKNIRIYWLLIMLVMLCGSCSVYRQEQVRSGPQDDVKSYVQVQQLSETNKEKVVLSNVPFIKQLPELRRGCEVTSLAMVLQTAGVQTDKMKLASEIQKVPFTIGNKHGNPYKGFVGNMYTYAKPGYGAYHKPIYELAKRYLGERAVDLTGTNMKTLYAALQNGSPVLVITNSTFKLLPEHKFQIWETEQGPVRITYHEHSVVMTGFDSENVYIHNPLRSTPHMAVPKRDFEIAWEQMGKQAISYKAK